MASSNKKKLEEENNLKTLREIVALPHNKHCFDCNQRGPTYVNMTIGSFVCTACSGLLRGLNPPHRVKSISMASFSNDEMEFVKCRGNEFCRKVWLGMYDRKTPMEVDSKDEGKMKEIMSHRYEKKRWYVHPPDTLFEEARKQNTASKQPATTSLAKPLSSLVAGLPLSATAPSNLQRSQTNRPSSEPTNLSIPTQSPVSTKAEQTPKKQFDILADFSSDPFATPSRASGPVQPTATEGFADFSAFNAFSQQSQSSFTQPTTWPHQASAFNNPQPSTNLGGILQPNSNFNKPATTQVTAPPQPSDKYSALAGLDGESSVFGSSSVDWDGNKRSTSWTSSSSSSVFNQQSSIHPPPPSYNSLTFTSLPNPFGSAVNPSSVRPRHSLPNPFLSTQQSRMPVYFPQTQAGAFPNISQIPNSFGTPVSLSSGQFGAFPAVSGLPTTFVPAGTVRPPGIISNGAPQTWGAPAVQSHVPLSWGTPQMPQSHNPFLGNASGNVGQVDSTGQKNPYNPFL